MDITKNHLPEGDPGLMISDRAFAHIKQSLKKSHESAIGVRVGVCKAGCSGYEYVLEYAYPGSVESLDFVFEKEDIKVVIDKESYLKFFKGGTQLDFVREGINEGFKFNNPNVAHQCGCGESFTLKDEK